MRHLRPECRISALVLLALAGAGCRAPKAAMTKIFCAASDVRAGTWLDDSFVTTCEMPSALVTDSYIRVGARGERPGISPVGSVTAIDLHRGDPILFSASIDRPSFDLSEAVPIKARAYAIAVTPQTAAGLNIEPNDHVDVLATKRDSGETRTILMDAVVLATGKTSGMDVAPPSRTQYDTVTLMLAPVDVQRLAVAAATENLSLSLRNFRDLDIAAPPPSDEASLALPAVDHAPRPLDPKAGCILFRGSSRTVQPAK